MIHHLHNLGPKIAVRLMSPPRHEIVISENVAARLELAYRREALRIESDG